LLKLVRDVLHVRTAGIIRNVTALDPVNKGSLRIGFEDSAYSANASVAARSAAVVQRRILDPAHGLQAAAPIASVLP